jgi:hypothetical protein
MRTPSRHTPRTIRYYAKCDSFWRNQITIKSRPQIAPPPSWRFHLCLFDWRRPSAEFAMRQFVPMTDEMLYAPGNVVAGNEPLRLVPYQCGVPCWHRLGVESGSTRDADAAAPTVAEKAVLSA